MARAFGWLVLVFSCVLIHELSHSLVARRRAVTVRGIVLLPIGGISQMEGLPDRPDDELAIAVAGPISSVAVAVAAAAVSLMAGDELLPIDFVEGSLLHRLAWFNLLLAGFNLLPAFPLDGGRALRAALARHWPIERATAVAAAFGRYVAVLMGAVGLTVNLWLLVIAVFVYLGASAEEAAISMHVRLRGRRVGDVMVLDPLCLPAYTTDAPTVAVDEELEQAVVRLMKDRVKEAAVVQDGRVVGLLRPEDVAALGTRDGERTSAQGRSW